MEIQDAEWFLRFYSSFSNGVCRIDKMFRGILLGAWRGGNTATVFLGIMALGSTLTSALKSVATLFLEDTAGGKNHPSIAVKKEEERKAKQTHGGYLGLVLQGSSVSFVSLHLGPIKYITYLFLGLFSKGEKKTKTTL